MGATFSGQSASMRASIFFLRHKTTSAQYVAARHRDPTLEKLMDSYRDLNPVLSVRDLIMASPELSVPLSFLSSSLLHPHRRGPSHFIRSFPAVFSFRAHPLPALVHLTPAAARLSDLEHEHASSSPTAVSVIVRLLSLSLSRTLPLRAIIRVQRDLGLPLDFDDSVIARNPSIFTLSTNPSEPNTHLVSLSGPAPAFVSVIDGHEFKQSFPPGMRLTKDFRARLNEWQRLPYPRPYDHSPSFGSQKGVLEKRAVAIAHEFLSLTVEKMVEVEKFSHFRKCFGIDFNVRDLFLDHPGIFYLSAKWRRHTVFLREAYDSHGCLLEPNPIYEARRRLLDLVLMRKRGAAFTD